MSASTPHAFAAELMIVVIKRMALIGFRGRGFEDVVKPDFCHHLLLEALIFQGPEK